MSFLDIVSKFNQQADSHSRTQSLNPFSDHFEQSRSPSPRFSREEYGKPVAGSKTDLRGRKAKSHICREILELCTVIHDVGTYNAKKKDDDDDGNQDDGTIIISFGELFQIYTKISDKVVGLLIAAKRRGFVYFDREILFQRRDDDVLIALLKPISEISKTLKEDIEQASAPAVESENIKQQKAGGGRTKRAAASGAETLTSAAEQVGTSEPNDGFGRNSCYCNAGDADGGREGSLVLNNVVEISETGRAGECEPPEKVDGAAVTQVAVTTGSGDVAATAGSETVDETAVAKVAVTACVSTVTLGDAETGRVDETVTEAVAGSGEAAIGGSAEDEKQDQDGRIDGARGVSPDDVGNVESVSSEFHEVLSSANGQTESAETVEFGEETWRNVS